MRRAVGPGASQLQHPGSGACRAWRAWSPPRQLSRHSLHIGPEPRPAVLARCVYGQCPELEFREVQSASACRGHQSRKQQLQTAQVLSGGPAEGKCSGGRIDPLTMINLTPKLWRRSRARVRRGRRSVAREAAQIVPPRRRTEAAFGSRPSLPRQGTPARSRRSGHDETERAASSVVGSPARFGVRGIHSQRTSAARRAWPPENQAQLLCRMGPTVRSVTAPKCPVSEGSALAAPVSRGLPP